MPSTIPVMGSVKKSYSREDTTLYDADCQMMEAKVLPIETVPGAERTQNHMAARKTLIREAVLGTADVTTLSDTELRDAAALALRAGGHALDLLTAEISRRFCGNNC